MLNPRNYSDSVIDSNPIASKLWNKILQLIPNSVKDLPDYSEGEGNKVDDVTVNGESVVEDKVAKVIIPAPVSDFEVSPISGFANYGAGGGGGFNTNNRLGAAGGSGIAIIRNHRN